MSKSFPVEASNSKKEKQSKGSAHLEALAKHHTAVHSHLRAAHAAAGSKAARQHINQAGMAANMLHKTAKLHAADEGLTGDNEYDQTADGGYAGD